MVYETHMSTKVSVEWRQHHNRRPRPPPSPSPSPRRVCSTSLVVSDVDVTDARKQNYRKFSILNAASIFLCACKISCDHSPTLGFTVANRAWFAVLAQRIFPAWYYQWNATKFLVHNINSVNIRSHLKFRRILPDCVHTTLVSQHRISRGVYTQQFHNGQFIQFSPSPIFIF